MRKSIRFLIRGIVILNMLSAQTGINWTDITDQYDSLPDSVALVKGRRDSPALDIYYLRIDLDNESLGVRPYITANTANVKTLTQRFGAYAAVNGGYFGGSISYSAVVYPEAVKAQNVSAVTRDGKSYPVIRSLFSLSATFEPAVDWIYHFGGTAASIYSFDAPLNYSYQDPDPLSAPSSAAGTPMHDLLVGIGGGPTLVKGGESHVTYNEEIFWGSGVDLSDNDPRTTVGYTADNEVILLVADGRQTNSEGVSLTELAEIMISLGCEEAMNLDGGGSTQMAVPGAFVNSPSEYRSVPTILALVDRDSIDGGEETGYEHIIDTGDDFCELMGGGWFPTANQGYWDTTAAMLNTKGNGDRQAIFHIGLNKAVTCEVFAWWVAASNRCSDTPYVIVHANGRDTIRVDQTSNHAVWNSLGTYTFSTDPGQAVIVSNQATSGTYVVADAIRLVSPDSIEVVTGIDEQLALTEEFSVIRNYPNPFNARTQIYFRITRNSKVSLLIYNLKGQRMDQLVRDRRYSQGTYRLQYHPHDLASGVYLCQLKTDYGVFINKMLLLK